MSALTAVALLLRVVTLGAQPLWFDEALTIVIARWPAVDLIARPVNATPGLYYIVHKLLFPVSASAAEMRLASLTFGVLAIPAMYLLGRLCFGVRAGLLSAALLAAWPMHIAYSQEARAYALLFLLTLGASIGLIRYVQLVEAPRSPDPAGARSRRAALLVFGVCNVLSFYTHMVAVFWIVATSLLLLVFGLRRDRAILSEIGATFALMALAAAPGLWRLLRPPLAGEEFNWLAQPSPREFIEHLATTWLPTGLWKNSAAQQYGIVSRTRWLTITVSVVGIALIVWRTRHRLGKLLSPRPVVPTLILAYFMMPLLLLLVGFLVTPIYLPRTILFSAPGFILVIAALYTAATERKTASVVALLVIGIYIASAVLYLTIRTKPDWPEAARVLAGAARPGDALLLCDKADYPALRHAAKIAATPVLLPMEDGSFSLIEDRLGSDPAWDETYFQTVWHPVRQPQTLHFPPGGRLWRLDSQCDAKSSAAMDDRLRPFPATPALAWSSEEKARLSVIKIAAYRFASPFDLSVWRPAPAR